MTSDLYAAWLTAGNHLQPYGNWIAVNWPNLAIALGIGAFGGWCIRRALRDRHHLPAAPDNLPPIDDDALITCRRIDRLGVRDPHIHRLANDHLRRKQRKEDQQ